LTARGPPRRQNKYLCNYEILPIYRSFICCWHTGCINKIKSTQLTPNVEEDVMKAIANALIVTIATASSALAASGAAADEGGFLTPLFLVFGAAIIALQVVPAALLLGSMVKGLFSAKEEGAEAR